MLSGLAVVSNMFVAVLSIMAVVSINKTMDEIVPWLVLTKGPIVSALIFNVFGLGVITQVTTIVLYVAYK